MYLTHDDHFKERFSPFGFKAFESHYHGGSMEDIDHFLSDVVLGGNDPLQQQRMDYFNQYLTPIDGKLPSEKILELMEQRMRGK